jgi:hypothetical protein
MWIFILAACSLLAFTSTSHADARADFSDCVDAYVAKALTTKPSLVDFTVALEGLCTNEVARFMSENDAPPTGNAKLDALQADFKQKMASLRDRYVKDTKGSAVAYYAKIQINTRKLQ